MQNIWGNLIPQVYSKKNTIDFETEYNDFVTQLKTNKVNEETKIVEEPIEEVNQPLSNDVAESVDAEIVEKEVKTKSKRKKKIEILEKDTIEL